MVILRRQEKKGKSELENLTGKALQKRGCDIGFAVDIGTTTIAVYEIEIASGKCLGALSERNRQAELGADVMLRIMNAISGRAEQLHDMVVTQIEEMAEKLLEKFPAKLPARDRICFMVVGNTTMCHLFLGRSVKGLAGYPFCPDYKGSIFGSGKEFGMKNFGEASVTVLAGIAAHVGSDATAVIGAEKLYQADKVQLAIDFGTNAEILLNDHGTVAVCSAAAGPAFEGKGVTCGMAAKSGAISGVRILKNGNIVLDVLQQQTPSGICSSGFVDLLAQMVKHRLLQQDGYLLNADEAQDMGVQKELCDLLVRRGEQNAFLVYGTGENEIYITQQDIRNIQLAKGAIQAGVQSLLGAKKVALQEVDEVVVAGVLGNCLHPENAILLGLLPEISSEKLLFAGNAAGKGAALALLDDNFCHRMEEMTKEIQHIELALDDKFQDALMKAMDFVPWSK